MDKEDWKVIAICGAMITLLIGIAIPTTFMEDDVDVDDQLAPYMCKKHGMQVHRVELEKRNQEIEHLKIVCRSEVLESVDDGYLVKIGG